MKYDAPELKVISPRLSVVKQDGKTYAVHPTSPGDGVCGHPMRGGRYCTMDGGHRGRHASVTFLCDGCGRRRRGSIFAYGRDGEYEYGMAFCFMCASPQINDPYVWP